MCPPCCPRAIAATSTSALRSTSAWRTRSRAKRWMPCARSWWTASATSRSGRAPRVPRGAHRLPPARRGPRRRHARGGAAAVREEPAAGRRESDRFHPRPTQRAARRPGAAARGGEDARLAGARPGREGHPEAARGMNLVAQGPGLGADDVLELARLAGCSSFAEIAERAFRFRCGEEKADVAAWCEARRIDHAWMPEGRRLADLGLLAMDMDSTLITMETIDELGECVGRKPEIAAITASAMRGEIDYSES